MVAHLFNFIENSLIFTSKYIEIAGIHINKFVGRFRMQSDDFHLDLEIQRCAILWKHIDIVQWIVWDPEQLNVTISYFCWFDYNQILWRWGKHGFSVGWIGSHNFFIFTMIVRPHTYTRARATVGWNKVDNMISILTELRRIYIAIEINRPNKGK